MAAVGKLLKKAQTMRCPVEHVQEKEIPVSSGGSAVVAKANFFQCNLILSF